MLRADDLRVDLVRSEIEALTHIDQTNVDYDAALVEPRLRGRIIRHDLFRSLAKRCIGVVVFSGPDPGIAGLAAELRVVSYVHKPASAQALRRAVLKASQRSAQLREWQRLAIEHGRRRHPSNRASVTLDGEALVDARRQRAWTQEELAAQAGVSPRTIRSAERGRAVGAATVLAIATALGYPLEALISTSRSR
jgi:DNA-binding XRE family transcriptional regulator